MGEENVDRMKQPNAISSGSAQVLTMSTQEDSNQQQVHTLLSIMQNLQPFLLEPRRSIFSDDEGKRPELDGGASASAVATFSRLCDRLDAVLSDKRRWDASKFYAEFQKSVLEVHEAHRQFQIAQTNAALNIQRPSFTLRPTLATMRGEEGNYFLAYWGDLEKPGNSIIGRGKTPELALLDFDEAFKRTPEEQVVVISDEPPEDTGISSAGGIILPPSFQPKPNPENPKNPDER